MNIDHIKYFCDTVEAGTLAGAAKLNNISPGAISQAIMKLELSLGLELVVHRKRSFELTDKGLEFYRESLILLGQYGLFRKKILSPEKMEGEFFFITQQSIAEYLLPKVLFDYCKK